jgi:hypothetical protein
LTKTRVIVTTLIASVGVLLTASAAFAVDIGLQGHGTPGGDSQGSVADGVLSSGGALPFTGLNLALIVLAGLALLATGLLLRRRTDSPKA